MLGEVSPVVFEANPASKITKIRSEDFNKTDEARELRERGYRLFRSLDITLDDIWWGDFELTEVVNLISTAVADFSTNYVQWAQEIIDMRSGGVRMDINSGNELSIAFKNHCKDNDLSVEDIAQSTSFTLDELRSLKNGIFLADNNHLEELSDDIKTAHNSVRGKAVITLCDELRVGLNPAEATRIEALLQKSLPDSGADEVVAFMSDFREKLIGGN